MKFRTARLSNHCTPSKPDQRVNHFSAVVSALEESKGCGVSGKLRHWTHRLQRGGRCVRCGSTWAMHDTRRRYCSGKCFHEANREYHRLRKQRLRATGMDTEPERSRRYRQSARGKAKTAEREARPEVKTRRLLLWHANEEARQRGVGIHAVLLEWKAPLGRVKDRSPRKYNKCRQCGKWRALKVYCSKACIRQARLAYWRSYYRRKKTALSVIPVSPEVPATLCTRGS